MIYVSGVRKLRRVIPLVKSQAESKMTRYTKREFTNVNTDVAHVTTV